MDTMEKATHREHSTFGMNKNEISIIVAPPTTMDWIDVGLTSSNCAGQKQKKNHYPGWYRQVQQVDVFENFL